MKLTESVLRNIIRQEIKKSLNEAIDPPLVRARAAFVDMDDMDETLSDFAEVETTAREIVDSLIGSDVSATMSDYDKREVWRKFVKHLNNINYTIKPLANDKIMIMAPTYAPDKSMSYFK